MILDFIDREDDIKILEKKYRSGKSEFVPVYGRRRVGKTEILKQFIETKPHFYFLAKKKKQAEEMERFRVKFSKDFNVFLPETKSWDEIFQNICKNFKERLVVIIDEFPFWIEKDKSVLSDFQHAWDEFLKDEKVFLILCGSYVSVMETDVIGYKSPLYGRRTGQLEVKKLGFSDFAKFFQSWNIEDAVKAYGALDGIPFYIREFDPAKDFFSNIKGTFWERGSVLNKEVEFLLSQELREVEVYLSIMRSVFEGATKLNEIASKSRVEITNINKYLNVLLGLKFIETESPAIVGRPKRKNYIYRLSDNFFNFWLSYVYPFKDDIEIGETESLELFFKKDYGRYLGFVFENIAKQILPMLEIPFNPEKLGRQWGSIPNAQKGQNTYEIDLVGLNEQTKEIMFVECKWQDKVNPEKVLEELKEKAKFVDWNTGKRKEYYCVIAKSFSKKIKEENAFLFDLKDIDKAME